MTVAFSVLLQLMTGQTCENMESKHRLTKPVLNIQLSVSLLRKAQKKRPLHGLAKDLVGYTLCSGLVQN